MKKSDIPALRMFALAAMYTANWSGKPVFVMLVGRKSG